MPFPSSILILEDEQSYKDKLFDFFTLNYSGLRLFHVKDADEGLKLLKRERVDATIVDLNLENGTCGVEFIGQAKKINGRLLCVVNTVFETDDRLLKSIRAGADGYIFKLCPDREIKRELDKIFRGEPPLSPSIAAKVLELLKRERSEGFSPSPSERIRTTAKAHSLSEREEQVLKAVFEGGSRKELADELGIARNTLNKHVQNIYRKLRIHSLAEAYQKVIDASRPQPD